LVRASRLRWNSGAPVPLVGAFIAALIALAFGTATLALWVLIVSFLVLNVTVLIAQRRLLRHVSVEPPDDPPLASARPRSELPD
jgi:membrane protein implicated in regulation of membrane protease activity